MSLRRAFSQTAAIEHFTITSLTRLQAPTSSVATTESGALPLDGLPAGRNPFIIAAENAVADGAGRAFVDAERTPYGRLVRTTCVAFGVATCSVN
jgi:hypothetical protein